ncbi:predicted protein [Sclerotinia sclerotiorum 1980 UF-70]|uniref:Uncharacterized protein n=1 Tax=Sclerotinia sclerotiorum (strain ATCC 18683 / 1980 / Ss-1) TaxID=665079 RepID=A7EYH4_SCLS1|nr:predicted protein [Sclerotinia sclerotiorum 1980 UF-70]EDN94516.1 predicted protein [Sclerotinia sclerotiorum 1980 UF-70]
MGSVEALCVPFAYSRRRDGMLRKLVRRVPVRRPGRASTESLRYLEMLGLSQDAIFARMRAKQQVNFASAHFEDK